jgi:hypothetical protein
MKLLIALLALGVLWIMARNIELLHKRVEKLEKGDNR